MNVRFQKAEKIAEGVYRIDFKPEAPYKYFAGQFAELHIPHTNDIRGDKRWFSLSSSPTEDLLSITTKISKNPSSFKQALLSLQPDQAVSLTEAMGDFVLPRTQCIPLIFIAGGVGISPVRAMSKYMIDTKQSWPMSVLYTAQKQTQHCYVSEITKVSSHTIIFTGVITPEAAVNFCLAQKVKLGGHPARYFLSGPEDMVDTHSAALKNAGIDSLHIVTDAFSGYKSL